jgi:hypothetical protein
MMELNPDTVKESKELFLSDENNLPKNKTDINKETK